MDGFAERSMLKKRPLFSVLWDHNGNNNDNNNNCNNNSNNNNSDINDR